MIHLEKITYKNALDVCELSIFEEQYAFVADNEESLVEAYLAVTSEASYAYPFAIFDDDTLVGFLMLGYNEAALEGPDAPAALRNNYSLWRLMIDKRYQRKGAPCPGIHPDLAAWQGGSLRHFLQPGERGGQKAVRLLRVCGERRNGRGRNRGRAEAVRQTGRTGSEEENSNEQK